MLDMDDRRPIGVSAVIAGFIVVVINLIQGDVAFAIILLVLLSALLGVLLRRTRSADRADWVLVPRATSCDQERGRVDARDVSRRYRHSDAAARRFCPMANANGPFGRILFADLQRSERPSRGAIGAVELAHRLNAEITVLDTAGDQRWQRNRSVPGRANNRQHRIDTAVRASTERLEAWRCELDDAVMSSVSVRTGRWSEALRSELAAGRYDLVIVSGEGRRHVAQQIRRLLRRCPCPLLVLRDGLTVGDVVVLADVRGAAGRIEHVVSTAGAFADAIDRQLHIVCPIPVDSDGAGEWGDDTVAAGPTTVSVRSGPHSLADARRRVQQCVDRVRPWRRPSIHVEYGSTVSTVIRQSEVRGAAMIVIGSSGHRGLSTRFGGNVAERLLSGNARSLLIVEPVASVGSAAISTGSQARQLGPLRIPRWSKRRKQPRSTAV